MPKCAHAQPSASPRARSASAPASAARAGAGSGPVRPASRLTRPPSRSMATYGCEGSSRSARHQLGELLASCTLRAKSRSPPGLQSSSSIPPLRLGSCELTSPARRRTPARVHVPFHAFLSGLLSGRPAPRSPVPASHSSTSRFSSASRLSASSGRQGLRPASRRRRSATISSPAGNSESWRWARPGPWLSTTLSSCRSSCLQDHLGTLAGGVGNTGEAGDVDAVGAVGGPRRHAVQEEHVPCHSLTATETLTTRSRRSARSVSSW